MIPFPPGHVLEVRWIPIDDALPEGWSENGDHLDGEPCTHHRWSRLIRRWVPDSGKAKR